MSDIVIKAENLGKKYTTGHQAENDRDVALCEVLVNNARNLWRTTAERSAAARYRDRGKVRSEVSEELI